MMQESGMTVSARTMRSGNNKQKINNTQKTVKLGKAVLSTSGPKAEKTSVSRHRNKTLDTKGFSTRSEFTHDGVQNTYMEKKLIHQYYQDQHQVNKALKKYGRLLRKNGAYKRTDVETVQMMIHACEEVTEENTYKGYSEHALDEEDFDVSNSLCNRFNQIATQLFAALDRTDNLSDTALKMLHLGSCALLIATGMKRQQYDTVIMALTMYATAQALSKSSEVIAMLSHIQGLFTFDVETCSEQASVMDAIGALRSIAKSPVIKHATSIGCLLVTLGLVKESAIQYHRYKFFEMKAYEANIDVLDVFDNIMAAFTFFVEVGHECFITRSITPMFCAGDPIMTAVSSVARIKNAFVTYKNGNYKLTYGKDESFFLDDVVNVDLHVKRTMEYAKGTASEKLTLRTLSSQMELVKAELHVFQQTLGARMAPFVVKIYGDSSIGKSTITQYLAHGILESNDFPHEPHNVYTFPVEQDHDTGCRSNISCYILDDMANQSANTAKKSPVANMIRLANNVTTTANMADLSEKGKILLQPKLLIATTNVEDVQAAWWSQCPKSILRRFHKHITARVRDEYGGSKGLNAVPSTTNMDDFWLFDCKTPIFNINGVFCHMDFERSQMPVGYETPLINGKEYSFKANSEDLNPLLKDMSLAELLIYLEWESHLYYTRQKQVVNTLTSTANMCRKCKKCNRLNCICKIKNKKNNIKICKIVKTKEEDGKPSVGILTTDETPQVFTVNEDDSEDDEESIGEVSEMNEDDEDPITHNLWSYLWPQKWKLENAKCYSPQVVVELVDEMAKTEPKEVGNVEYVVSQHVSEVLQACLPCPISFEEHALTSNAMAYLGVTTSKTSLASSLIWATLLGSSSEVTPGYVIEKVTGTVARECASFFASVWNWFIPTYVDAEYLTEMSRQQILATRLNYTDYHMRWMTLLPDWFVMSPFFSPFTKYIMKNNCLRAGKTVAHGMLLATFVSTIVCMRNNGVTHASSFFTLSGGLALTASWKATNSVAYMSHLERKIITARSNAVGRNPSGTTIPIWLYATRFVKVVGAGSIIAGGIFIISKAYRLSIDSEQATLSPQTDADIRLRDSEENPWMGTSLKVEVEAKTYTPEQLCNIVAKNVMKVSFKKPEGTSNTCIVCNAVMVCSGWVLVPYHMWFEMEKVNNIFIRDICGTPYEYMDMAIFRSAPQVPGTEGTMVTVGSGVFPSTRNHENRIYSKNIFRIGTFDLALIYIGNAGGVFRNILEFFPSSVAEISTHGSQFITLSNSTGTRITRHGAFVPNDVFLPRPKGIVEYRGILTQLLSSDRWNPGECCSPIISRTNHPVIVGLHLLGGGGNDANKGMGACVLRSEIQAVITRYLSTMMLPKPPRALVIPVHLGEHCTNILPLRGVSLLSYTQPDNLTPIGAQGVPVAPVTMYMKNKITFEIATIEFGPTKHKLPNFAKTKIFAPYEAWLQVYADPVRGFSPEVILPAKVDYLRGLDVFQKFPSISEHMRPLSDEEIVSGIDGVRFLDGASMSTAMGFPFKGKKSKFYEQYVRPDGIVKWKPKDEFLFDNARQTEENYAQGITGQFFSKACLKDEVVAQFKNGVPYYGCRVFFAACFSQFYIMRKYFLPLARPLSMFPLLSECAVGINCFGPEYEELHQHLIQFGEDNILCGDHKKYDIKLSSEIIQAAFDILIEMARRTGKYNSRSIRIMEMASYDISHANILMFGVAFRACGSNPSGHNLTSYINSIANSLLIRIIAYRIHGSSFDFRKNIALATYGDDLVAGVSPQFSHIHYNSVAKCFFEHHNMIFTPATKGDGEQPDFLNIYKAGFLKRTPVYHPELGLHLGALEQDSIIKSLYWYRKSALSVENVTVQILDAAAMEYFCHGDQIYTSSLVKLRSIAHHANLVVPSLERTYSECVVRWKKKYDVDTVSHTEKSTCVGKNVPVSNLDDPAFRNAEACLSQNLEACLYEDTLNSWEHECDPTKQALTNNIEDEAVVSNRERGEFPLLAEELVKKSSSWSEHSLTSSAFGRPTDPEVLLQLGTAGEPQTTRVSASHDETFTSIHSENISMETFLARPVVIAEVQLFPQSSTPGVAQGKIDVLRRFLASPRIKPRIANYSFLQATVHIRVILTGTSFNYGKWIVAYEPWSDLVVHDPVTGPLLSQIMQLPHIALDFGSGLGGELEFDILTPFNGYSLIEAAETPHVCSVWVRELNKLKTVSNSNDMVSFKIMMWMTNVKLSVPTTGAYVLTEQAGEEEIDDPRQMPHTNWNVPDAITRTIDRITPYARASQDIVNGAVNIATLFGYSRPSSELTIRGIVPRIIGNVSNCNVPDDSVNVTIDNKREVTVDPKVIGVDMGDEMSVVSIASREVYLGTVSWGPLTVVDSILARMAVSPMHMPTLAGGGGYMAPSPMAMVALPCRAWRGSMEFRVEIIASAFHRGKLRITYDPFTQFPSTAVMREYNAGHSVIVDLTESRSYTFRVGWASNHPYKRVDTFGRSILSQGDLPQTLQVVNGYLVLTSVTSLVAPNAVPGNIPDIYINVYAKMCEDFQVADPTFEAPIGFSPISYQTALLSEQAGLSEMPDGGVLVEQDAVKFNVNTLTTPDIGEKLRMIHFGESYVSIRQLLKRYCPHGTYTVRNPNNMASISLVQPDFPVYRGFIPPGAVAASTVPGGTYNWVRNTPINWYTPCFLAYRGGIRWKNLLDASNVTNSVMTYSVNRTLNGTAIFNQAVATTATVQGFDRLQLTEGERWEHGAVVSVHRFNNVLSYEVPYHHPGRFRFGQELEVSRLYAGLPRDLYEVARHRINITTTNTPTFGYTFKTSVAAADDFQLIFWKYSPIVNVTSIPTTP